MTSKYTIECSVTPLCPSCGDELNVLCTQSRPSSNPLERDYPHERTDRRVFIQPCHKCFVVRTSGTPFQVDEAATLLTHASYSEFSSMPRDDWHDRRLTWLKNAGVNHE